ncbi:MAG: L,D-transpeptidase [Deltaproteobacteria bacterium]|nr:L,D-transpeptidase [Deltaproteobacteria bacterium]
MKKLTKKLFMLALAIIVSGCSSVGQLNVLSNNNDDFLPTGSLIISRQLPVSNQTFSAAKSDSFYGRFAPLMGFIPPSSELLPALNQTWLEIAIAEQKLSLYQGNEQIFSTDYQGIVNLLQGNYAMQIKQSNPLWYAGDEYFLRRELMVPAVSDPLRLRRGALGRNAIYVTSSFIIHDAPIYSSEVGGIRISSNDMAKIFPYLDLGTLIIIK